jgi:hypothetical protein
MSATYVQLSIVAPIYIIRHDRRCALGSVIHVLIYAVIVHFILPPVACAVNSNSNKDSNVDKVSHRSKQNIRQSRVSRYYGASFNCCSIVDMFSAKIGSHWRQLIGTEYDITYKRYVTVCSITTSEKRPKTASLTE